MGTLVLTWMRVGDGREIDTCHACPELDSVPQVIDGLVRMNEPAYALVRAVIEGDDVNQPIHTSARAVGHPQATPEDLAAS